MCSLILPNELRPYTEQNQTPINAIVGPITIYSRMNIGQILEGIVSKTITKSEIEILEHQKDSEFISDALFKISKIATLFNDTEYVKLIQNLANEVKINSMKREQLIGSIKDLGLYFEAPNFANFKLKDLLNLTKQEFGVNANENIIIPRKTLQYLKQKMDCNIDIPPNDITIKNIFTVPIYTTKLKQESKLRLSARDLGSYKSTSKQPTQGRGTASIISQASRLGYMEFDALLASGMMQMVREFRTVKSDCHNLKHDLALQYITTGKYDLPDSQSNQSFTKMLIKSYIDFLNN